MTVLLEQAFNQAAQLPAEQQDALAEWIIAELESDYRWQQKLARSSDLLSQLVDEAQAEQEHGETETLDPERLL